MPRSGLFALAAVDGSHLLTLIFLCRSSQVLKKLQHPNIISLHHAFLHQKSLYIVMEHAGYHHHHHHDCSFLPSLVPFPILKILFFGLEFCSAALIIPSTHHPLSPPTSPDLCPHQPPPPHPPPPPPPPPGGGPQHVAERRVHRALPLDERDTLELFPHAHAR